MREKIEKTQGFVSPILPLKRLVVLDGLLKKHIAAQLSGMAREIVQKNYSILTFPLRFIKLPAKAVFSTANIFLNTASISFSRRGAQGASALTIVGRLSEYELEKGIEVTQHAVNLSVKHGRFKLSYYIQAALLCKPLIDSMKEGIDKLPDFYSLTPLEARKLITNNKTLQANEALDKMLEDRIIPKKDLSAGTLDLDEAVRLIEADFPDIYRDYAIGSFEASLSHQGSQGLGR